MVSSGSYRSQVKCYDYIYGNDRCAHYQYNRLNLTAAYSEQSRGSAWYMVVLVDLTMQVIHYCRSSFCTNSLRVLSSIQEDLCLVV